MRLGTHGILVNEVVDLFQGVAQSKVFPNASIHDITSIDEATRAAWEDLHGEDEMTWSDIRSFEMRAVWSAVYASKEFKEIESELKELIDKLSKDLVTRFRGSKVEAIGEDVIQDMQNAVYARAVFGASNSFFEAMIQAYKDGAWPCGWEGDFPDGRLLTFAQSGFV